MTKKVKNQKLMSLAEITRISRYIIQCLVKISELWELWKPSAQYYLDD